ncbi:MAG TPA: hypothetical protein PK926_10780 [Spirochaetota bacterium]|nr:hypothetical protein [Spirochaetota bacterium]HPI88201.1 hypothetical protein [Spirochaetota bacterium]
MSDEKIALLVEKIRDTASTAFHEIPDYQVFRGTRDELADKIIAIAWRDDGEIAGFCSTVILEVKGVGKVIHLGLTIVRPEDRSGGLTHILTHKAVAAFLFRYRPIIGKLWITNCAAVLSSLVNVSLFFEKVYPSPKPGTKITRKHQIIARAIDTYYRDKIYISDQAMFDHEHFVFRGSVKDTVFQKKEEDTSYYHRNIHYNEYFKQKMKFENGDEVLQIGFASTFAAIKHLWRNVPLPKPKVQSQNL